MKYLLFMIFLISFWACTKYSDLVVERDRTVVHPVAWGLDSFDRVDWKVGAILRDTVSRGVLLVVKLPLIENDKLSELMLKKDVDGWILKIIKHTMNSTDTLGYVYIPFPNPNQRTGINGQIELATFQINYHASAVSERFSNLSCPAFGHRKYLKNLHLEDEYNNGMKLLNVSVLEEEIISGKVEPFSFNTRIFSSGNSLQGSFELQIAFYNFKKSTRKSNFLKAPQVLKVAQEEERFIEGCGLGNDEIQTNDEKQDKKVFKFGQ